MAGEGYGDPNQGDNKAHQQPPVYWSVLHHKNVQSTEHDIDRGERRPLAGADGGGAPSADYQSVNSQWWSRVKDAVRTKELFIRHSFVGDANGGDGSDGDGRRDHQKWSDVVKLDYEFTLRECLYLFVVLLAIGAFAYSCVFEDWSILDSVYFTTVLLTTVGYGDVTPTTVGGKLFASIFSLGGIVILGLAMGVVGSQLVEAEIRYTEKMESKRTRVLERAFAGRRGLERADSESSLESLDSATSSIYYDGDSSRSLLQSQKEGESSRFQIFSVIARHLPGFVPLIVGGVIMGLIEPWGLCDSIYFCVVTSTVRRRQTSLSVSTLK